jgi:hypothetical protein
MIMTDDDNVFWLIILVNMVMYFDELMIMYSDDDNVL